MSKNIKALVVFSGGLDSILAVKTLQEQDIDVSALCFESNFYNAEKAKETVKQLGIKLETVNISDKMLDTVKNPSNGYGKNMNPCIDCHSMMFRLAGEYMKENNFDILATGEVLGQRPFSQNKDALKRVASIAGVEVLRPLSAKLLDETIYEREGMAIRVKMHDISGRTREGQLKLVEKYGIKEYPSPAGGCLLTDPEYSDRLRAMLDNWPYSDTNDVELIKNGRTVWYSNGEPKKILAVIGRNALENEELEKLAKKGDIMLQLKDMNGPTTLLRAMNLKINQDHIIKVPLEKQGMQVEPSFDDNDIIKQVAILTAFYAVKARGKEVKVSIKTI